MPIRMHCEIEGLGANWVEFADNWTRREAKFLTTCTIQQMFDKVWPEKATACHIERPGMEPITDPKLVTLDSIDDCDQRVYGFLVASPMRAAGELFALGNASARLSDGSA